MTGCAALRPQTTYTNSSPEGAGAAARADAGAGAAGAAGAAGVAGAAGAAGVAGAAGARELHERLVAYAHFVAGDSEARSGVWSEHSYARAREGAAPEVRELLSAAPRPDAPAAPGAPLNVEHVTRDRAPALPVPTAAAEPCDSAMPLSEDEEEDDDWAERLSAEAPSGAHARLACAAVDALRELRLARLATAVPGARGGCGGGGGAWLRREQARAAARRLRRALAPLWAGGGAAARPPCWLHGALSATLPRTLRALYDEVLAELRRAVPRLAERLSPQLPPVPADPLEPIDDGTAQESWQSEGSEDAVLVWVCVGGDTDERWLRRLRPLIRTREIRAAPPWPAGSAARLAPDRWCAAAAGAARAHLNELLAEIGSRYVVLGGAGAGAALCVALAAGAGTGQGGTAQGRVRAVLLLAPPLLTAEGARDEPDDILHEMRLPMLVVCGGGAACGRAAGAELVSRAARGERAGRRLLLLGGADEGLRAPAALRRTMRLPQHALDAAVVDECARWMRSAARGRLERTERTERVERLLPDAMLEEDEYAHTPAGGGRAPGSRVVTRVSGGTPLALVPPRRAPDALELADIMQLPIVFADDEPPAHALVVAAPHAQHAQHAQHAGPCGGAAAAGEAALTVRSGARGKLTRVIVARRGARAAPATRTRSARPPRAPASAPAPAPAPAASPVPAAQ